MLLKTARRPLLLSLGLAGCVTVLSTLSPTAFPDRIPASTSLLVDNDPFGWVSWPESY
jgi:hypothetical protein